jgi:predicted ATP-dependent protease
MPKVILDKIKIHPVKFVDEVFTLALKGKPIRRKIKQKKTITSKSKKVDLPKNLQ